MWQFSMISIISISDVQGQNVSVSVFGYSGFMGDSPNCDIRSVST